MGLHFRQLGIIFPQTFFIKHFAVGQQPLIERHETMALVGVTDNSSL